MSQYGKQGYEPGVGRTFTPSIQSSWTGEFNHLLESLHEQGKQISRNALTEKLIEDALRQRKSIILNVDGLTLEQVNLLQSHEGQQILKNLALMMIGNQQQLAATLPSTVTQHGNHLVEATEESSQEPKEERASRNSILEKALKHKRSLKLE